MTFTLPTTGASAPEVLVHQAVLAGPQLSAPSPESSEHMGCTWISKGCRDCLSPSGSKWLKVVDIFL